MKKHILLSFLLSIGYCTSYSQIVTTTNDKGPGSLRQAIIDANDSLGNGEIIFNIPITDGGYDSQRGVFTIKLNTILPPITHSNLFINGPSQTLFTGNTNAVKLGNGGTVGTDSLPIAQIEGPEIEIVGDQALDYGFKISAKNVRVQGLAIYGFGSWNGSQIGNIVVDEAGSGAWIESNCLGSFADRIEDPGKKDRTGGSNIAAQQADSVTIKGNILVLANVAGIYITDHADGWLIEGNEIANNSQKHHEFDGIDLAMSQGGMVKRNLIVENGGSGIDSYLAIGGHTIVNNTVINNGWRNRELSGIRLWGVDNKVERNIIAENRGSGILVASSSERNTLSQNSIYQNGYLPGAASLEHIGIDLLESKDNHDHGTPHFITLNDLDDLDEGGNGLLNYPVMDKAVIRGDSIYIAGWASPNAILEFFLADRADKDHPQGMQYLFSFIEGSSEDQDTGSSAYNFPHSYGNDNTHRFMVGVPVSEKLTEGAVLVATATLNGSTSEFSPKATLTNNHLVPLAGCMQINADGDFEMALGYHNYFMDTLNVALGSDNNFLAKSGVPPVIFYPGTHLDVSDITIDSTGGYWILKGDVLKLDTTQGLCPVDLRLSLETREAIVNSGDTVWLNASVENLSSITTRDVSIDIALPAHAQLLQSITSDGDYQAATGQWTLQELSKGNRPTLSIQIVVSENTSIEGIITASSQPDNNSVDNQAVAHFSIDQSSSSRNGGTESNGNLASKIALRNFHRQQIDLSNARNKVEVFTHDKVNSGEISKASAGNKRAQRLSSQEDLLLIPENSLTSKEAVVVTPDDLIGITNANEIFSVDYLNDNGQILGAILYIRTQEQVYEHSKAICDRLNGGTLTDIRHVYVQGKPFILSRIDHPTGDIDYNISFIAYETSEGYTIDNRWRLEEYKPESYENVLNFQVWSVSPVHTMHLVDTLLQTMKETKGVQYKNNYPPVIPKVYVKSGYYADGHLHLNLNNTVQAQQADIWGTLATTEDGQREPFQTSVNLGDSEQQLSLPINRIFDAGFTLANNLSGGMDALYLADGPWGIDYEQGGAHITAFVTKATMPESEEEENVHLVERNALMEGNVLTYASLFRSLRPGSLPLDLQKYNQLSFHAFGTGDFEVILTKKSINQPSEQFRHTFSLNGEPQQIVVPFSFLTNQNGEHNGNFTAEDVTAIVFNALGDEKSSKSFQLGIENLRFLQGNYVLGTNAEEDQGNANIAVFPNPAKDIVNILVTQQKPGDEIEITIMDFSGNPLQTHVNSKTDRNGTWYQQIPLSLSSGVYMLKVTTPHSQSIVKFIKL